VAVKRWTRHRSQNAQSAQAAQAGGAPAAEAKAAESAGASEAGASKSVLEAHDLACGYHGVAVVEGFNAHVETGSVFCLLGPNGVGKTTLFKTILGLLPRISGSVTLDGRDINDMDPTELARSIAYVPQRHSPPFAFTVRDVVMMGAIAQRGIFGSAARGDAEAADQILADLGVLKLADRVYTELSGGERQMVLIARALAQNPRFLMMDEPTSSLDYGNQVQVLKCVRRLADSGLGVIMTTHFPEHIAECKAQGTLVMPGGGFVSGDAREVLTPEHLRDAYGIEVAVMDVEYTSHEVTHDITVCQPLMD
jgi:iron complex transport system ATP-binding protein